ncbi:hypothetical protein JOM56_013481, partial [Amanita muscaria]
EQEQNNHVNSSDPLPKAQLSNLQLAQEMIQNVQDARLEDDIVDEDLLASLRNPPKDDVKITPLMRFCLKVFLSLSAACEKTYNRIKAAFEEFDMKTEMFSFFIVKSRLEKTTGVFQIETDMCMTDGIGQKESGLTQMSKNLSGTS